MQGGGGRRKRGSTGFDHVGVQGAQTHCMDPVRKLTLVHWMCPHLEGPRLALLWSWLEGKS